MRIRVAAKSGSSKGGVYPLMLSDSQHIKNQYFIYPLHYIDNVLLTFIHTSNT